MFSSRKEHDSEILEGIKRKPFQGFQHPPSQTPLIPKQKIEQATEPTPMRSSLVQQARRDPHTLPYTEVLFLQRTLGNRAVTQMFQDTAQKPSVADLVSPFQQKASGQEPFLEARSQQEAQPQRASPSPRQKEPATGLPDALKAGVESLSGVGMDDVHVHYNSAVPAEVQALAYTQGTDIHVGPGQEKHLAHEAWHVVQQKQRRVKPTLQAKGVAINADQELEREADAMGARAATLGRQVQGVPLSSKPVSPPLQVLQAVWERQPTENVLSWTPPLDGVTWFKDQKWMWFQITHASDIQEGTLTAYQSWENKLYPYDFWQQARKQPPDTQPPPLPVVAQQTTDPISSIMATDLSQLNPVILENSRAKRVYLFDAAG